MRFIYGVLLLVLAWPHEARAQAKHPVVQDDFQDQEFSPANWFACIRTENAKSMLVVERPGGGGHAAELLAKALKTQVSGRQQLAKVSAQEKHAGCTHNGVYTPVDDDQRAELWEKRGLVQPVGTDTWIQFDFMVVLPPGVTDVPHLVVGQMKLDGGSSPVLAQRFSGRRFTVTIEQDNTSMSRFLGNTTCRVTVAHDSSVSAPAGRSVGHDRLGNVRQAPGKLSGFQGALNCKRDLDVEERGKLPSAFNRWVRMTYHIKPGIKKDGLLEVWADGKLISRATGRIGYRDSFKPGQFQYFKFGPYSDRPMAYDTKAYFARYRRAGSCAELGEPTAPECLSK